MKYTLVPLFFSGAFLISEKCDGGILIVVCEDKDHGRGLSHLKFYKHETA
jgi:hypothetical protein